MRRFVSKAGRPIWALFALFGLSFAFAATALGAAPYYEGKTVEVV